VLFTTTSDLLGLPTFDDEYKPNSSPSLERKYVYFNSIGTCHVSSNCTQRDISNCPWFIASPLTGEDTIYQAAVTLSNSKEFRSFMGLDSPSDVVFKNILQTRFNNFMDIMDAERRKRITLKERRYV